MSRPDFEARLAKLTKPPASGARRAVQQGMLDQKIHEMRADAEAQKRNDEEQDTASWVQWLNYVLMLCFMVLAGLFVHDPEEAKRKAIVMVPLMALFILILAVRAIRRDRLHYLFQELDFDLDFLSKLAGWFR